MPKTSLLTATLLLLACAANAQSVTAISTPEHDAQSLLRAAEGTYAAPSVTTLAHPWSLFTVEGAAGATQPNGNASDMVDLGFNVRAGAGVNLSSHTSLLAEYEFQQFGWKGTVPGSGARDSGTMRLSGVGLEPQVHHKLLGPFGAFAEAGAGYFRRTTTYSQQAPGTGCDPLYGCYYSSSSSGPTTSQVGANAGFGLTCGVPLVPKLSYFLEVRYEWLDTRPETAAFFP